MSGEADLVKSWVAVFNSFKIELIAFYLFIFIYATQSMKKLINYMINNFFHEFLLVNNINFKAFHFFPIDFSLTTLTLVLQPLYLYF